VTSSRIARGLVAAGAVAAAVLVPVAIGARSGAAFTTDAAGVRVNANQYPDDLAVYLNGGPPCQAAARSPHLPDGWYAFRVTDPSGRVEMSTDDVSQRMFRVRGGKVVESADPDAHPVRRTACGNGNLVVRVGPFRLGSATGVYKAWIVPAARKATFPASASKTDNFSVRASDVVAPPPPPPPPPPPDDPPPPPPPPPDDPPPPPPPPDDGGGVFVLSPTPAPAPAEAAAPSAPAPGKGRGKAVGRSR
jgi:hypothetical protein